MYIVHLGIMMNIYTGEIITVIRQSMSHHWSDSIAWPAELAMGTRELHSCPTTNYEEILKMEDASGLPMATTFKH